MGAFYYPGETKILPGVYQRYSTIPIKPQDNKSTDKTCFSSFSIILDDIILANDRYVPVTIDFTDKRKDGQVVLVDWGDGIKESHIFDAMDDTQYLEHFYEQKNSYVIRVYSAPKSLNFGGHSFNYNRHFYRDIKLGGNSADSIGSYLCYELINLNSVTLANNINTINDCAFKECVSLKSVVMSNRVEFIGEQAFCNCYELEQMNLPVPLTEISNYCFSGCKKLKSISFGNNLSRFGYYCFSECESLESMVVPNTVTELRDGVFESNKKMESLYIPKSVVLVGRLFDYKTNPDLTINCQHSSKPEGWDQDWNKVFEGANYRYLTVNWGVAPPA